MNNKEDEQLFEKFDSRGKLMTFRQTGIDQGVRYFDTYSNTHINSFAVIDIDPKMYLTIKELKQRANTLSYAQYKREIREYQKHLARKKMLWVMSVVKAKVFIKRLKQIWERQKEEEKQRAKEEQLMRDPLDLNAGVSSQGYDTYDSKYYRSKESKK